MAITEPGCGSDSSAIQTTAQRDGDHWVINGTKIFCTSGLMAAEKSDGFVVVWATLDRSAGRAGIKAFVVEAGTPGMYVTKVENKLGIRASDTATLVFEDCRVPLDKHPRQPRGPEDHEGFKGVMATLTPPADRRGERHRRRRAALDFVRTPQEHGIEIRYGLRDLGAAEDVVERHPAVLEDERRRVRGPDAELVLDLGDVHAGRPRLDHERLDAGAAGGAVERRPHHHEAVRLLGAMRPLVQKILVPLMTSGRHRAGPWSGWPSCPSRTGFGDRHRRPLGLAAAEAREEALLLLRGTGRRDPPRRRAGVGIDRLETRVTPGQLLDRDADGEVALGTLLLRLLLAARETGFPLDTCHIMLRKVPRLLVLALVVLARDRPHSPARDGVHHLPLRLDAFGQLEIDHGCPSSHDGEAVEAGESARVAEPELHRMLADVAVAAEDLARRCRDVQGRLAGVLLHEDGLARRRRPESSFQAASQVRSRIESISIAMSASLKAIACFCAMATPKARRSLA